MVHTLVVVVATVLFFSPDSQGQVPGPTPTPVPSSAAPMVTTPPAPAVKASVGDQSMRIVYGSPAWNTDSKNVDSAFLFMRDKKTGKTVKIQLEETEPDSSIFAGNFAIQLGTGGAVDPDIYIPPRTMKDNADAMRKFNELLAKSGIKPKPLFIKPMESGGRQVDVYDTLDQVKKAREALSMEEKARKEQASLLKPVLKTQDLEAKAQAERAKWESEMAIIAAKREADRVRAEQIERQKALEIEKTMKSLSAKEKSARKAQAAILANAALDHFNKGEFEEASQKYEKATQLDPDEKSYSLSFGIALYRTNRFNQAIVVLKTAQVPSGRELEREYYMGLTYYRLNEYDSALESFRAVAKDDKSPLAASSSFYEGLILFNREQFEASRAPFERVIDISQDPRLDEQAESYLDRLSGMIRQQQALKKRWFFNGMVGGTFDSNVLLTSDLETSQGAATEEADFRTLVAGDAERRFIYTKHNEFGLKAFAYYLRSTKTSVSEADPLLVNLTAPFAYKGTAFGKGYKLAAKPIYEYLFMDQPKDGSLKRILTTTGLSIDNTFVMKPNHFAAYLLELRSEDSLLDTSTGDDNLDAMKVTLKTNQTFLLDKTNKKMLIASAGYVINQAEGDNKFYNRYDLGVTYIQPTEFEANWSFGISYYLADYNKGDAGRVDRNTTFTTGLTKPVKEWVSWNVTGTYVNNVSTESANHYSKYTIMAAAVFNYQL